GRARCRGGQHRRVAPPRRSADAVRRQVDDDALVQALADVAVRALDHDPPGEAPAGDHLELTVHDDLITGHGRARAAHVDVRSDGRLRLAEVRLRRVDAGVLD